jgi:S1-C subfamily serine protease
VIEREAALSVSGRAVARTVDDLMASVVAVVSPTGEISSTGFVVDYPRVVVIDGYVGNTGFIKDEATLATSDGRRLQARVLKRHKAPFGPVILEAPGDLKVPGLQLNTAPVTRGATVRIGVAAGTRIGVSSGIIKRPKEVSVKIEPIGLVKNLVEIDAAVAPGASGAPVVDEQFAVCGFVVAGRPDQPPALMYPAARWAKIMSVKQESRKQRARKYRIR